MCSSCAREPRATSTKPFQADAHDRSFRITSTGFPPHCSPKGTAHRPPAGRVAHRRRRHVTRRRRPPTAHSARTSVTRRKGAHSHPSKYQCPEHNSCTMMFRGRVHISPIAYPPNACRLRSSSTTGRSRAVSRDRIARPVPFAHHSRA
ncbi:hypothetical protein EXIGLDRAFT_453604 [Exidia glandulosa HHB12029]|uniref:Uncharacterized protein n=1 Tax=Exidia glandulosa HHB12029 TaxID=1314781 RepID=A0A165B2S9_EXIGL|nr:hypothetical protein EXIGLDRAFT_453604 [Exidia glandulosa HHB12029]